MTQDTALNPIQFEVIRNRLVAITEEMRIALQSVSGSPTVTEASDFFTGLFLPDGSVASMGFQVAYQAPVCGLFIRHISQKTKMAVRDGDMFIGNDPYVGALHQNDVQMVGPIFVGDEIVAWAGVEAHETDVGGMDFASWSPKAREVYQEGMRIPCVKIIDQGEMRDDVLEMICTASRLPHLLELDIRAFVATLNVARERVQELAARYGAKTVTQAIRRMIASSEARMRERLRELPDGQYHASDFLEHDGHQNVLYKIDVVLTKSGDAMTLDFSGSSPQAPGFINSTRSGLMGAVAGAVMPTLAFDMQWNEGALAPVEIVAPEGLLCTAKFPAPVGSATVETIWVTGSAVMRALNKMLQASPKYRHRAQGVNDGAMATFNLGGVNQFGEPFGLHLMDPLAGGSAAWPTRDGASAGGPITSPMSSIADVERNEQVAPLFYIHRRLARDTGGAGRQRGGLSAEVALTLAVDDAMALVMTHGAESPNSRGLAGGWPGATIVQTMGWKAVERGVRVSHDAEVFGPKPGLMKMTNRDLFEVSWQGGGGWGDPLARDPALVAADVADDLVSEQAAREAYGVVLADGGVDAEATQETRSAMRLARVGAFDDDPARRCKAEPFRRIGDALFLARDGAGAHVVTAAGYILSTGHTRWREGAASTTRAQPPSAYRIKLHEDMRVTEWFCPATGALLEVDFHEAGKPVEHDMILKLEGLAH
ncbi:MAG: 5-oxoprolinase [Hyphomicrobiales bacterium]|nr:5-oxoprolinase [Hyphomicrobiales bacterium]